MRQRRRSATAQPEKKLGIERLESRDYLSTFFAQNSAAEFAAGLPDAGTYVAETTGGEVTLAPQFGSEFSGWALPTDWSGSRPGRRTRLEVTGGDLTLDHARARSNASFGPGQSLEFVADFGSEPSQRAGFGLGSRRAPWAVFATSPDGQLVASTWAGRPASPVARVPNNPAATTVSSRIPTVTVLAGNYLGEPHRFRIDWQVTRFVYSVDGVELASHDVPITRAMRAFASDATFSSTPLVIDWVRAGPYSGSGEFLSRVLDAHRQVTWGTVSWVANTPEGTSLAISVRTGDTRTPDDGTWSDFQTVASSGTTLGVTSRYLQYRVEAATTGPERTPVLEEIRFSADGPLASVGLGPGWATFGEALPQGAARDGLQIGNLTTQTDVKARWTDGSIRFAIVSAAVPEAGVYDISEGLPSSGSFTPSLPDAAVLFNIGGTVYTAALPDAASDDRWLSGPLVQETRYTVAPQDSTGTTHPFLRVIFDTRSYQDGQGRLDVTVENTLDTSGATELDYDVDVLVGGQTVFSHSNVTHWYLTRWRKVFDLGLSSSSVAADFEPFFEAQALPRYLDLVENTASAPSGPKFDILQIGDLDPYMPAHGGRPELAPYPDWTARYLAHRNPTQGRYVLAEGDLAGTWPIHLRKSDGSLITIDERPNFWLDSRADADSRPLGDLSALGPFTPDIAHQPSLAYVPYLVTGDRYYADELRFWANYDLIRTFQDRFYNSRRGAEGWLGGNEVRGIAWGLRNLTDAAAYLPDDDPLKSYFADKVRNNLIGLDAVADGNPTPLKTLWEDKRPENEFQAPKVWISTWEQNYLAWSIDHANRQGFVGGLGHRDRIARFQLDLFTSPGFNRAFAGSGVIAVGVRSGGKVQHYADFATLFRNNFARAQTATAFQGYYGVDARLMLMIALDNNWASAREAYDYLFPQIAVQPYVDGIPDLARRAGWAIARD
ncbi:MAG: hypothetical protein HY000_16650 [Planctomycetes bacterium]|nr:hypothetical protein [Planctomycetota bacterium]